MVKNFNISELTLSDILVKKHIQQSGRAGSLVLQIMDM